MLVTALLVLAIAASSALVFTNRTELLKLAVILALWAAVVAAFVSMIYRRQSDIDQAKARDLKLVYDLQLDREIAARREYELEVETQLRRELSAELRGEAADEVAALRAELAALRNNLEILFDTDLAHRPAIETERTTVRAFSDWARDDDTDPGRLPHGRFTASARQDVVEAEEEDAGIIDVHEEPAEPDEPLARRSSGLYVPPTYGGGAHRLPAEEQPWAAPVAAPQASFQPPEAPQQPVFPARPEPAPARGPSGNGYPPSEPRAAPVAAEPPHGRHRGTEPGAGPPPPSPAPEPDAQPDYGMAGSGRRARHSVGAEGDTAPPAASYPAPAGDSQHGEGQGQSVAELLARLQAGSRSAGGRRRRRED
jgi:hypothetical protein